MAAAECRGGETPRENTDKKIARIYQDIDEAVTAVREEFGNLMCSSERLDLLIAKTDQLAADARRFRRREPWWWQRFYKMATGGGAAVLTMASKLWVKLVSILPNHAVESTKYATQSGQPIGVSAHATRVTGAQREEQILKSGRHAWGENERLAEE